MFSSGKSSSCVESNELYLILCTPARFACIKLKNLKFKKNGKQHGHTKMNILEKLQVVQNIIEYYIKHQKICYHMLIFSYELMSFFLIKIVIKIFFLRFFMKRLKKNAVHSRQFLVNKSKYRIFFLFAYIKL